ncbi:MAG: hypothetical protein EPO40_38220 [Myxococcaceae bacterium]|nr:MAG: hypothetical protein EPO40_38220 [Myxococcaceae bacterium]
MSNTPIAATAGSARQRLASSLAALQQDPSVPPAVLNIVQGLARAMGPLFQVERGTGDPSLLFQARTVLQETLGSMQSVDQSYPGVGDATAAIAQSLGMLFAAIKEHALVDPSAARPAPQPPPPPPQAAPVVQQPPPPPPQAAPVVQQPPPPPPQAAPVFQQPPPPPPQAAPVPLTQPAAQPMPLTTPAAQAVPLVQPAPQKAPPPRAEPRAKQATVFPETAAKVPIGPQGLPRVEAELEAFSDTNFYTNFVGDIRDHGGIFVATYAVLAVNTRCQVALKFPGDYLAEFHGVVKWRRESTADQSSMPGMGIEITDASADVWALIHRFIQKREPIIQDV